MAASPKKAIVSLDMDDEATAPEDSQFERF